jgi:hypothetical protein
MGYTCRDYEVVGIETLTPADFGLAIEISDVRSKLATGT